MKTNMGIIANDRTTELENYFIKNEIFFYKLNNKINLNDYEILTKKIFADNLKDAFNEILYYIKTFNLDEFVILHSFIEVYINNKKEYNLKYGILKNGRDTN